MRICSPQKLRGIPSHAGALRHAEQVAAGAIEQQLVGERQASGGARSTRDDVKQRIVGSIQKVIKGVCHVGRGRGRKVSNVLKINENRVPLADYRRQAFEMPALPGRARYN